MDLMQRLGCPVQLAATAWLARRRNNALLALICHTLVRPLLTSVYPATRAATAMRRAQPLQKVLVNKVTIVKEGLLQLNKPSVLRGISVQLHHQHPHLAR